LGWISFIKCIDISTLISIYIGLGHCCVEWKTRKWDLRKKGKCVKSSRTYLKCMVQPWLLRWLLDRHVANGL
jgi:hypothetical protein